NPCRCLEFWAGGRLLCHDYAPIQEVTILLARAGSCFFSGSGTGGSGGGVGASERGGPGPGGERYPGFRGQSHPAPNFGWWRRRAQTLSGANVCQAEPQVCVTAPKEIAHCPGQVALFASTSRSVSPVSSVLTQMGDEKDSWKVKTLDEILQEKKRRKEQEEKAEIKRLKNVSHIF
uniref:Uncharacterized protein n=1 Tax=Theropithecus gelada TaxID=9565 RepID=A0A8D2K0K4_THEGE